MSGVVVGTIGAAVVGGIFSSKAQKSASRSSNRALAAQLAFQKEQQAKLDAQKEIYKKFEFENPYAGLKNPYAGIQTQFENVYEDLTVSTQAAEFQMEQGAQQRANVMQQMRGAAGGSGIASLAQALAGQGALQSRQVSVGIAQQERQNMMARASGAAQVQQLEASREELIAKGASATDMAIRGGEAMVQEAEMSRQATLLGVAYGGAAGAGAGVQSAYANQMAVNTANMQMQMQTAKSFGDLAGNLPWQDIFSSNTTTTNTDWKGIPYQLPDVTYGPTQ